ncbi:putative transaminase [Helianthus annuus]|nr:putative transaminase [Helianthus annuus]KAJ0540582.1 putative transaminase [Helianthus annuus]KAJ0705724.1 putative transaminase [Helianthus annuus]KAJ0886012.1 putative transaminase [Helianthus annuus]
MCSQFVPWTSTWMNSSVDVALKDYRKFYKMGTYSPYTTSIQLLYGLKAFLNLIFEEGLDNVIARHTRIGTITRLAVHHLVICFHSRARVE